MAVVIRMKRTGRTNRPCYRISVADRAFPRDGRTLDNLGLYDPASPKPELRLTLNVERAREWVARGALPSETVRSIFERGGVYEGMPKHKPARRRPGRKKVTAKKTERLTKKSARLERKKARHDERVRAKRANAKATAGESAES